MRTNILLAAATATTLIFASVGPSAVAQGGPMGGPTMSSKAEPKATKAPKKKAVAKGYLPSKVGAKGPGRCGTHMYWKAGKCHDARTAPPK